MTNPFERTLKRGDEGCLCTGSGLWAFVALDDGEPGEDVALELRKHERFDERRHGRLVEARSDLRRQGSRPARRSSR